MDEFIFADEQDEPPNIELELARFRRQWRDELSADRAPSVGSSEQRRGEEEPEASIEDQARYLFMQGVNAEQNGHLMDAIQYYRRAVQMVPDIEFKVDYKQPRVHCESESSVGSASETSHTEEEEDEDLSNLIQHFSKMLSPGNCNAICEPLIPTQEAHISNLPVEVINYILKWVVSNELDILSLENIACVCRGFFLCARDEELWRLICQRVWGVNCGSAKDYKSWRNMFLERPHLRFNGCYISKMSYLRQGERGLDNSYKPYQVVQYYRYVRFFPEGKILMLTSPEDPMTSLSKIRQRQSRVQGILHGYYKMAGDQVTAALKRYRMDYSGGKYRARRRQQQQNQNEGEQTFHVEFSVTNIGRRACVRLAWKHYSVHTVYKSTGQESIADFSLNNQNYPPLVFSRVKSYTSESDTPLG